MMIPTVRRTWAPCGKTPLLHHHYRRERISVIGGLSVSPRRRRLGFYFRLHDKNISHEEVHDFLHHLLRHLRGHVMLVWDGASIHAPGQHADLLRRYPRLHLERLPAYAPQLNPVEAAWHLTKWPLANGRPDDIWQLGEAVFGSLKCVRASQRKLRGCFKQSELPPFLP